MRLGFLAALAVLASFAHAISSNVSQVHLAASRSGLATGTTVTVKVFDASGQMLASGSGRISEDIAPGTAGRVSVRLDREVDSQVVREVGFELATPSRQAVSVTHLAYYLGQNFPRVQLVDELFGRPWVGRYDRYRVSQSDERSRRFSMIRVTGRVVDGVEYRNDVEFWIETTSGKTYVVAQDSLLKNQGNFNVSIQLPESVYRGEIKRLRVYSGRSRSYRITSFNQLFEETDDVKLRNVKVEGGEGGRFYPIRDIPVLDLTDHRLYESPDLSGEAPKWSRVFRPGWFNVYVFTGNDDLRWDPNVQPNMEIRVNLYIKGNSSPIPIVSRSINPYASFANGGVWGGSFAGYDIAERIAPWRDSSRAPRIQDIEAIEIETIPGWDGSTPERRILRGQGDPFRQPDTWAFRGIWVGASESLPTRSETDRQALAGWSTILTDFSRVRRLQVGQKVRFPVQIVEGNRFNPALVAPIRPRP